MNILEVRRRTLGKGVYKKTAEGDPAIAQGSLARRYPGIAMQGWTNQNQYEGNQLLDASVFNGVEKSGVSVSVDNGVITASGMSESAIWIQSAHFTEEDFEKFKSGNIYVKNYKTSECNYEVSIYINNTAVKEGNSPYPIPDGYLETKPNNVYFFIDIRAGIELKGSCKPMIYQDGDGTYEPYTGGQPSPNPDYPQEIVSAGKYDEGTGKYQYEITLSDNADRAQNLTLISDRPLTKWDKLEKRSGQWGWVYKSAEIVLDGSEKWQLIGATSDEYQGFALKSSDYNAMESNLRLVCDKFAYSTSDKINTCRQEKSEYGLRFVVSTEYVPNKTVAEFKNWLQSNPITVLYQLAEPVFVPLSASEQEQMNELYTFRPTTVLSNDCECEMTLAYKTKKSLEVTT